MRWPGLYASSFRHSGASLSRAAASSTNVRSIAMRRYPRTPVMSKPASHLQHPAISGSRIEPSGHGLARLRCPPPEERIVTVKVDFGEESGLPGRFQHPLEQ